MCPQQGYIPLNSRFGNMFGNKFRERQNAGKYANSESSDVKSILSNKNHDSNFIISSNNSISPEYTIYSKFSDGTIYPKNRNNENNCKALRLYIPNSIDVCSEQKVNREWPENRYDFFSSSCSLPTKKNTNDVDYYKLTNNYNYKVKSSPSLLTHNKSEAKFDKFKSSEIPRYNTTFANYYRSNSIITTCSAKSSNPLLNSYLEPTNNNFPISPPPSLTDIISPERKLAHSHKSIYKKLDEDYLAKIINNGNVDRKIYGRVHV